MWCILFDMQCRERNACSKCNAELCIAFFSSRWGISFSVADVWLAASKKSQWKHVNGDREWKQKNANKRMFVCNKKKKMWWSDGEQMYDAKCMSSRRPTSTKMTTTTERQTTKHNVFLHHYLHWFVFTIVIILLLRFRLFFGSTYKKSFPFGIWFVLLPFGRFCLFICTSHRCSLFLCHAQRAHANKKKTKSEHQIHDQNQPFEWSKSEYVLLFLLCA